ncbi:MAG: hypothetical protein R3C03_18240 [Pirellulaceae bacterium]
MKRLLKVTGVVFLTMFFGQATMVWSQDAPFQEFMISTLSQKQVVDDLQLVDDQAKTIQIASGEYMQFREELIREFKNFSQDNSAEAIEARREELQGILDERKREVNAQLKETLLPHQLKRLTQLTTRLVMQETAKNTKVATGLLTHPVRDYLEIDDEQAAEIENEAKRIRKELEEKIAKLTIDAQKELLETLTPEQRKQYEEMVGEPLESK